MILAQLTYELVMVRDGLWSLPDQTLSILMYLLLLYHYVLTGDIFIFLFIYLLLLYFMF